MNYSPSRVGRQTLIYGGGVLISKALAFAMMPIYIGVFEQAEYGIIALVEITLDVLTIVAGSRLATGIFRFYHKAENAQQRGEVLTTALLLISGMYALVGIGAFLGADLLGRLISGGGEGYGRLMRVASIVFIFQGVLLTPMAYLRLMDKATYYVWADVGRFVLQLSFNVLFLIVLDQGPIGAFYSSLIASCLVSIPVTTYLLRDTPLRFSAEAARNLLRFGLPMVVNQVATFVVTFADRFVLQRATNEAQVGIYALAFQFGLMAFALGYTPYQMIWDPVRYEAATQPNKDFLLSRGFRHLNLLLITVSVGLVLFTRVVLRIMDPNAKFIVAADLVPYLVAAHVLLGWAAAQDLGILISERTKFVAIANWIAAGMALIGFYTLIPAYGAFGAAVTCLASFFVRWLMIYTFAQRLWPIRYDWPPVLRLAALGIAVALAGELLPTMGIGVSIGVRTLLVAVYFIVAWHIGVLTPDERAFARWAPRNPGLVIRALRAS